MDTRLLNYSATSFPAKLIQAGLCHRIKPLHATIYPTNSCNLKCPFCNCRSLKPDSLSWESAARIVCMLQAVGTKAITLSGGGEPLAYSRINTLLDLIAHEGLECGIITNGTYLQDLYPESFRSVAWIRVSVSGYRDLNILDTIQNANIPERITLGLRYITTDNNKNLRQFIAEAIARENIRYIYITDDILKPNTEWLDFPKHPKVILEDKSEAETMGCEDCRLGLLKPHFGADGYVYPCCLVGLAGSDASDVLNPRHCLCHWSDYPKLLNEQKTFDGGNCTRCFYGKHNDVLRACTADLKSPWFV